MLRIAILLLAVTGIHGSLALADESSGRAHTQEESKHTLAGGASLEEIRVTAHPFSETDEHIVRPVQVLSKDELRTRSISNIGETVANEPGVTSSDYGTGVGRPVIRGQSGNRVQVLEDGLSTMDVGSFSADHAVTAEAALSRQVEIFHGPAALLFGSGASGGIINVVKGRILDYVPNDVEGEVALQYETVSDGMTGAGRLNFGVGNFAFHIDGIARNTDDYNIPGFAELEPGESQRSTLANSNRKTENISGGLSWVGARGYAGFSVSRYETEYGLPGHHHHHGHEHGHDDHDDHDDQDHDEEEHHDDEDGPHLATTTFEIGDTGLAREKSNNIDIYWRKTAGTFTVSANFFYNRIDDYIYTQDRDLNGDGFADRVTENFDGNPANILAPGVDEELFLVYISQDDAEFLGFEAETRARLMDDNNGRMVLRLWADYVEGERSNNINLPRITPWRFGSGLTWSRGDLYAAVNYTRVNKQDSTAPLETETGGYHLLDIHTDYTFRMGGNSVTLFARASNLLDEEIRRHVSFVKDQAPLPGRSGIFDVRIGF